MEIKFEKQGFGKRLKSMLKVDFKRMFTMPLVYIMAAISFVIPVLILIMTTMMGGAQDGAEAAATFSSVWQSIGSVSGEGMSMNLTGMCNINMLYFLVAVLVCVFVAQDFKSGYVKNLFAVRAKKSDYVISKSLVTFAAAAVMFIMYLIGAMIGGAIAGLSFETDGFGAGGIVACFLSKIFIIAIFVALSLLLSVAAKQKLWLSILGSFAAGMLLFTMITIVAPLNANFVNVILCLVGGVVFATGIGAVSNLILNKSGLV